MAITFPLTGLFQAAKWRTQSFYPYERQEISRQARGTSYGKSFGAAIWRGSWVSVPLDRSEAIDIETILQSLDGVIGTFYAGDLRRKFPNRYADGNFSETGVAIHTIGENNKSLRIDGLSSGFILSRGDYLAAEQTGGRRLLYRCAETVTADGSGITPLFEVRPHLLPGHAVDNVVKLKNPTTEFRLESESVNSQMQDSMFSIVSFSAVQAL